MTDPAAGAEVDQPPECVSHHHACDCREWRINELVRDLQEQLRQAKAECCPHCIELRTQLTDDLLGKSGEIERLRAGRVGMPSTLWLHQFGVQVWSAFGHPPYLVGSVLRQMRGEGVVPNDVDVRVILPDDEYETWGLGDPKNPHLNAKWIALVLAFSELGRKMTGLPIDFQIQQQTEANRTTKGNQRSAIGITPRRLTTRQAPDGAG